MHANGWCILGLVIMAACGGKKDAGGGDETGSSHDSYWFAGDGAAYCEKPTPITASFELPAIVARTGVFESTSYSKARGTDGEDLDVTLSHNPEVSDHVIEVGYYDVGKRVTLKQKTVAGTGKRSGNATVSVKAPAMPKNATTTGGFVVVCKVPQHRGDNAVLYFEAEIGVYGGTVTPFGTAKGTIDLVPEYRDASDWAK